MDSNTEKRWKDLKFVVEVTNNFSYVKQNDFSHYGKPLCPISIEMYQLLIEKEYPTSVIKISSILMSESLSPRDLQILCVELNNNLYLEIMRYYRKNYDSLMYFVMAHDIVPNDEVLKRYIHSDVLVTMLNKFPQINVSFECIKYILDTEEDKCFPFLTMILKRSNEYELDGWKDQILHTIFDYTGDINKLSEIINRLHEEISLILFFIQE